MNRSILFLRYLIIGLYSYTWYEHLKIMDLPGKGEWTVVSVSCLCLDLSGFFRTEVSAVCPLSRFNPDRGVRCLSTVSIFRTEVSAVCPLSRFLRKMLVRCLSVSADKDRTEVSRFFLSLSTHLCRSLPKTIRFPKNRP